MRRLRCVRHVLDGPAVPLVMVMIKQTINADGLHTKCETSEREFRDEYLISDLEVEFDYLSDFAHWELIKQMRKEKSGEPC
jgi:hypothetical protein